MKIGLGIVAFEGTEFLNPIINELKDMLHHVVIGYQNISYHGDKISDKDLKEIINVKKIGLADEILEIKLDTNQEARQQETAKRNKLLDHLEAAGCTHALIIDSDEFYNADAFRNAISIIEKHDAECTYCEYINYYHDLQHYEVYPFEQGMYVPFITKIKYRFVWESKAITLPSDPTRRYNTAAQVIPWETIKMHHLSWVRDNIRDKLNAWSSKKCFPNYDELINEACKSYDNFDQSKDEQYVKVLFNTPNNMVLIKKLPQQYITLKRK